MASRDAEERFAWLAAKASWLAGTVWAFGIAVALLTAWATSGPFFGFSNTWQLVINTFTTIVTFLMVFLIQHTQNKETRAIQAKLNELIAATRGASNRLIDVEDLTDRELERLHQRFMHLAKTARRLGDGAQISVDKEKS